MRRTLNRDRDNDSEMSAAVHRAAQSATLAFALLFAVTSAALAADLQHGINSVAGLCASGLQLDRLLHRRQHWRWLERLSSTNFSDTLGSTFTAPTNVQFLGGGQVGANYQFRTVSSSAPRPCSIGFSNSQNAIITATDPTGSVAANIGTANARWLTTVSGRLGYAWDRVLLYAKGGGAWVATNSPAISVAGTPASFTSISNSTSSGYTAGFGVEWAFSGNWSVRAEYAYIGLPSQSFTVTPGTPTFGGDVITFSNRNISMVTGAVNYKFGGW